MADLSQQALEAAHSGFVDWVKSTGSFTDWSRLGDGYAKPLVDRAWRGWLAAMEYSRSPTTLAVDGLVLVPKQFLDELRRRSERIQNYYPRGEHSVEQLIATECLMAWPLVEAMLSAAPTGTEG